MRDIGTSGEHYFMALCAGDGIVVNKSQSDKNGWDVLVEIDRDISELTQQTLHEPVITGTVQIKSTETKSLKTQVELSNLRKMATSSLPTFYLLVDFSQGPVPTRAFLLHVDESLSQKILERVNSHLVGGRGNRLHKLKMVIDFGLGQEITLNSATSIRAEFLRAVGSSQAKYIDKKQRFLKTVGFENGSHSMRFSLVGADNLQGMIDASLGRGGPVELKDMQIFSMRFGLEDPRTSIKAPIGTLVLEPPQPSARGKLRLRNGRTGDSVQVDAAAYVSAMHVSLPSSTLLIRIDGGLFDWYLNPDGSDAKFVSTLDPKAPVNLEDLSSYLQIVKMLAQPEGISLEMDFNGSKALFTIKGGSGLKDYSGALKVADALLKIKVAFGDRGLLEVSLQDLLRGSENILGFSAFLNREVIARVDFSVDEKTEPFEAVCLVPLEMNVGGKYYLAIIAVPGEMSPLHDGRFSIPTTHYQIAYKTVLHEQERTERSTLEQLQQVVDDFTHPLPIISLVPTVAKF
ncbi:hypothetical protein OH708_00775 [Pseudomonas capsici]|uniref:hypothetical protein n=1 Tax=Pseudomonas capsici TaxID=2810614 RepID=UPI0021F1F4CD|nr:hypothetical protein [Pseudomonas capsici]MCV4286428.1 hypothetical protein [Pseudomonas capsici]